jgi:Uma2 family endonuclease
MSELLGGMWGEALATTRGELHPLDMSDKPPRREASYEDLEGIPPQRVGEIVGGELYLSPRPSPLHTRTAGRLFQALSPFDKPPGDDGLRGWVLLFEPELRLGKEALVPDLAGWRRERLPELPETAAMTLAPDWVCEVLSASTEALDRGRKMGSYAREGVKHLWLVDPRSRLLESYRLEQGRWSRLNAFVGDSRVRAEPFEAIEIRLGRLWEW